MEKKTRRNASEYEKKQIVIFDYQPSRKGECASRFLDGYKGYFVSDGYAGYNRAGEDGTTTPPRK